MTTRFKIEVRDGGYRQVNGATFEINRHPIANMVQLAIRDHVRHDAAAVLMNARTALRLAGEMCSQALRAGQYNGTPTSTSAVRGELPPIVYSDDTRDAEGSHDGGGRVDLHHAPPLGAVLMVVYDQTVGDYAGAWFDAEDLMKAGSQLAAESRRADSCEV